MKPAYVIVVPWRPDYGGGVNEVVLNLYRETQTAGELQPLLLVEQWSAVRPVETSSEGRRTVYLRLWSPWLEQRRVLGLIKWFLAAPLFLYDLVRLCRRHHVVAFHVHFPSLSAFPIALLRRLGLYRGALILSFHGLDLRDARAAGRIAHALWKFVFRSATAIVACSRALADDVTQFAGRSAKRTGGVRAIHNGLDIPHLVSTVDRTAGVPPALDGRAFILSVATWERKKGLDVLLRAFAQVRRTHPGLALVLVGRASHAELELRALARELGVADDVFFYKNVSRARVGLFLERARAFCLASRVEPFGIAILEAGAYHLPVVASRVGGIPEIVVDSESGLLVEPEDVQGLAAALDRVLRDGPLARDLGERLHQRVASEFSWRRAHDAYRALVPQ